MPEATLADYVRYVERHVDRSLLEASYLRSIERTASRFPARLAAIFGFETHLTDVAGRADFAFKVANDQGAKSLLLDVVTALSSCGDGEGWKRLQSFAAGWCAGESRLDRGLLDVWLEFDIAPDSAVLAVPSVFVTVNETFGQAETTGLFREIVRQFRGESYLDRIDGTLARCLAQVPGSGSVPFLGLMLSRPTPAVRLSVAKLRSDEIGGYLARLSWPGDHRALGDALGLAGSHATSVVLDLDVGEGLLPTAGLELYFGEGRLPERPYRWEQLLDRLVGEGLCQPAKRQGLLRFPGTVGHVEAGPRNLAWAQSLLPGHRLIFVRKLSHLKLVFASNRISAAKAYLEARLYWARVA